MSVTIHMNKILNWLEAKSGLAKYKKKEIDLRNEIVSDHASTTVEGKDKEIVGNYKIEYIYGINKNLDRAELDTIWDKLSEEEKDCFDFQPKIKMKEYKALLKSNPKSLIFGCVTDKPAQTKLEVKEIDE